MLRFLFALARLLGDAHSISRGRYHKRLYNRAVGRSVFHMMRWR